MHGVENVEKLNANQLVNKLIENEIIPQELTSYYTNFEQILKTGLPTLRNNISAHGQGVTINEVSCSMAKYAINLCGANYIFIIESSEISNKKIKQ